MNYSRQRMFDQSQLLNGHVTVIGQTKISEYLCAYLAAMGIGKISLIGEKNEETKPLQETIFELNPDVSVKILQLPFHRAFVNTDSILVDTTNSLESKFKLKQFEKYLSASSSTDSFIISPDFFHPLDSPQGDYTSAMAAAILVDEIRKQIFEEDINLNFLTYSLGSNPRFFSKLEYDNNVVLNSKRVLVVGAGGIGTYACLNLIPLGAKIDLFDGDKIEDHNLNRQIFYYNAIGENKAQVLAKRLKHLTRWSQLKPNKNYLDKKTLYNLPDYDCILSCVDNWETRKILSKYALITETSLINASVTAYTASLEIYVPGLTSCLECRHDFDRLMQTETAPASCSNIANSNIVSTNAFIGAMMAAEFKALSSPQIYPQIYNYEFLYDSQSNHKFAQIPIEARCVH
ncbi:MAG: ThiF family adenylyltransferase [archaeon]